MTQPVFLNTTVDTFVHFSSFMLKKMNRATMEQPRPDGKVTHVAVDIKELGIFNNKTVEGLLNKVYVERFKMEKP